MTLNKLLIALSVLIFPAITLSAQESKTEKRIRKLDQKYLEKDKFGKGIRKGKKLDKRLNTKGETPEESFAINAYLNKAYRLNGNPIRSADYLGRAMNERAAITAESPEEQSLTDPGMILVSNGHYAEAAAYLEGRAGFTDKLHLHFVLIRQGEMIKAMSLERELSAAIESGKAIVVSSTKKEKRAFYANEYRFYLQIAERLREQGDLDSAATYLNGLKKSFRKNAFRDDELKAEYYETFGKIALDHSQYELAEEHFDAALEAFLKEHKIHHPKAIELLANTLQVYYLLGKDRKLLDQVKEHYKGLDYYRNQRSSLNTLPLLLTDMERKVAEGDFREADRTAASLLALGSHFSAVPDPAVYRLYSNLYSYYISRDQFAYADSCQQVLTVIGPQLYGEQSPATALQKLQRAQYKVNYEFDRSVLPEFTSSTWDLYVNNYTIRHYKYFSFVNSKAQANALGDQLKEQNETLDEAAKTAELLYGRDNHWARQLVVLAEAELGRGNFNVVPGYLNQAMPVLESTEGKYSLSYLTAARVLAEYYEHTGRLDEARDIYRKTFRRLNRLSRRAGVNSFSQPEKMAQVMLLTGDYKTAEKQLNQAIAQKSKTYGNRSRIVLIEPYVLSAQLSFYKGNYIQAQESAQRALEIGKELNLQQSLRVQQANRILADVDYALGDYQTAERRLEKIVASQEKTLGHQNPLVAASLLNLAKASYYGGGSAVENKNRVDDAAGILTSTLGRNSLQLADAKVYQALFASELGQYDSAKMHLHEASEIYASQLGATSRENTRVICLEGDVLMREGKFAEAEASYLSAAANYRGLLGKEHPDYLKTQSKLARVKCRKGAYSQAFIITQGLTESYQAFVREVFPFLSEKEKARYWQQLREDFDLYYALAAEVAPTDQKVLRKVLNSRINTKALLLRSSVTFQKDVRAANDEGITLLFDTWLSLRRKLAASFGMSPAELAESEISIADLEADISYNEKLLRRKLYGNAQRGSNVDRVNELYSNLKKEEVLIEAIRYSSLRDPNSCEYAFLVADAGSKKIGLVVSKNGNELENGYYRYYRNAIRLSARDKYSYSNFWAAIDSAVADGKTIYFSPDGVYGLMNPETFSDNGGRYIIEKNPIVFLNNPGDLSSKNITTFPSVIQAELVGNPVFYATPPVRRRLVKDLPATGDEIREINEMLLAKGATTAVMTQSEAREDSVKHLASPSILHFATHGYFEESENSPVTAGGLAAEENGKHPLLQSGLLLANSGPLLDKTEENRFSKDGILTAFEAKDLNLGNTELVVLSACETGLGKVSVGEGVMGLQRAFLDAGSNSVMMSLFKVNDLATQELMQSFYKNWMASGNKQEALVT
ncbi:MAG: CHAT domain-containing protein, partial [Bacteroidota bacterium]